jgi:M6 family metalloprotease-like protein
MSMSEHRVEPKGGLLQALLSFFNRLLELLRGRRPPVAIGPRVTGFTPTQGQQGTLIEIQGSGFAAARADNHVRVGGVAAWVVTASATRLRVITGVATQSGPVEVEVGGFTGHGPHNFSVSPYPSPGSTDDGPPILYLGAGAGSAADLPPTGTIRLLVVPVHAADRVPANPANVHTTITNHFTDAGTYYLQASYNALTINVTVATWHQLSGNFADYVPASTESWAPNIDPNALPRLHAEAAQAAESQGHDLDNFDMMAVVLFTNGQFIRGWGNMSESSFSYQNTALGLNINVSVGHAVNLLDVHEDADPGRCAHEIGHNIVHGGAVLGEDIYSAGPPNPPGWALQCAQVFDIMGSSGNRPLFSGYYMQQLTYYSGANIVELDWDHNPRNDVYELVAHGTTQNANPNRYHLLRIKVTHGLDYYVEVRQRPDPANPAAQVFDSNIPLDGAPNSGGVVVTKVFTETVNNNQQTRLITLMHDARVLKNGDTVIDPLRTIRITVLDDNVVARPLVCRVRVEWAQNLAADPNGQFNLWLTWWDANYQSDDIWIDRQPWGTYDHHDAAGNPVGNGDHPRPNQVNHFWARVHNTGAADAQNVRLSFYAVEPPGVGDNGTWAPLQSKQIATVVHNNSAQDFVEWSPDVGRHTCLKVVAEGQLGETNLGDNWAQENVFEFEAPASSVPDPLVIPVAVRNPLKDKTIALLSLRGLPEGFIAQLPHAWVWLGPQEERKLELVVVPLWDYPTYQKKERPTANINVDGRIPHSYRDKVEPGIVPPSVMRPMGGILARVTPKQRGTIDLWEDKEYNKPVALGVRGRITPPESGQAVSVELTDPKGRLRVVQVFTEAGGNFHAGFNLTQAPSEDPYGKKPGDTEAPLAGTYRAQAFIINASRVAECASGVVEIKK